MTQTRQTKSTRTAPSRGRAGAVLAVACAGQFMVVLDVTVVNVALPAMRSGLGFGPSGLQWVVIAYALAFAGFLLLGGRLADLYGRKRVFVLGLALFSLASLVGGMAATPGTLIGARAVQGLGAAVLAPASLTVLTTAFTDGHARARALATWSAVSAAGGASGSLVGGVLTEFWSWRWTLLINLPVGAVVIAVALRGLTESRGADGARRLGVPGALLATLGPAALTYGIGQAPVRGWTAAGTLVPLAAGVLALAAFVLAQRWSAAPLMPPRLFRSRTLRAGNVLILLLGAGFITMWYFLTLYMQNVLGMTALQAGLGFVPHTLVVIPASKLAPRLLPRLGSRRLIMAAALLGTAGFAWQALVTPGASYASGMLGPGVVMCAALGLLMAPIVATASSAATDDAGIASGLLNAVRQVGGAIGLAVLTTLAVPRAPGVAGLAGGYVRAFWACAAIMLAIAVCAPLLPPKSPRVRDAAAR